ncbi:MAG: UDP-N-acetylmuramoyl-tripeptide--D-alanyl-D-alanine ligase [Puniceicoccales bacterium]|jgi:UDP-N-acetylmuramoyl-tripeptide--D-alanyl-D-alanine ligase|nr:UDP-N-acetylmuramoyl-tripeptide--D-alanyl-D-alanine ligase [Puniceicoccales bacterium]
MTMLEPEIWPKFTPGQWVGGKRPPEAGPFCHDSRRCRAGEIFLALRTERADGHAFGADAQRLGASAAIVESYRQELSLPQFLVPSVLRAAQALARAHRFQWGENGRRPLVAVAGSYGKTTTKDMLALLLGPRTLATCGNENNALGISLTLSRLGPEHAQAVVEIGVDHPGEMALASAMTRPEVGVMTGIAPVHAVHFRSLEELVQEKLGLLREIQASGGKTYFPASCLLQAPFRTLADAATVLVSRKEEESLARGLPSVVSCELREASSELWLDFAAGEEVYAIPPLSRGQAQSLALALCVAREWGCARGDLQRRLRQWRAPSQRGQWKSCSLGRVYLDCYNANPVTLRDAVDFFHQKTSAERRIWVLGGMRELGIFSAEAHRHLGKSLPLRQGDAVLGIGHEMEECLKILRARAVAGVELEYSETGEGAGEWLRSHRGSFFVKGSRHYALERLFEGFWD